MRVPGVQPLGAVELDPQLAGRWTRRGAGRRSLELGQRGGHGRRSWAHRVPPGRPVASPGRAPLHRHPHGGRDGARRRRRGAAGPPPPAPAAARGHGDRGGRPGRAVRPRPAHARARRRHVRAADVGLHRRRTRCPTTIPAALERRVRVDYPVRVDRVARAAARRRRCACSARCRAPGGDPARARRCSCGRTGCGSCSRTGRSLYLLLRHRERFPRGAAQIYATFDLGARRLLGRAHRAAVVRGAAGLMRRRPTPRAAADDGRVRRAVLGRRWAPLYGVLGGNPLAAMPSLHFATSVMAAHLLAETGPGRGRGRLDLRRDARLRARLPRRALRRRPARRPRAGRGRARAPRRPRRRRPRASRPRVQALEARGAAA